MSSWLELCGDDSNLSVTSVDYSKELSSVVISRDTEFGSSRHGINLLFKTNVKIIEIENSQSRKRKIHEIDCLHNEKENITNYLPPKAKQRTNIRGDWKQRKDSESDQNFSRFLNGNNSCNEPVSSISPQPVHTTEKTVNTCTVLNVEENVKRRRITPILENVVFNSDLILNKVPILVTKTGANDGNFQKFHVHAPIFLNADQMKLNNHADDEQPKKNENPDIKSENESNLIWNCTKKKAPTNSWAFTLFSSEMAKNVVVRKKEERNLVSKQKTNRLLETKIQSLLPVQVNRSGISLTPSTNNTHKTHPSLQQIEWRAKQILIGQSTVGFQNCCKKYPDYIQLKHKVTINKLNNLVVIPIASEEIGKKRWIGKYQKWRKFLHQFDADIV